ncbi:29097_t:CDS:2, partial [Racocetra persica]
LDVGTADLIKSNQFYLDETNQKNLMATIENNQSHNRKNKLSVDIENNQSHNSKNKLSVDIENNQSHNSSNKLSVEYEASLIFGKNEPSEYVKSETSEYVKSENSVEIVNTTPSIMRSFQACGGSSVISIGAGTLSDIFITTERGRAFGWFYLGPLLGPVIGPTIGGYLTQYLGWRFIFGFLSLYGG